ncbi:MAG TPA: M28 family peptidase [Candidatus Acidoferrum sp.]|nr:M28 family peptidase [Candidatus Acidoferrum sp.]
MTRSGDFLDAPSSPGIRRIASSALVLAAILALSILGEQPPAPKGSDAPETEFSAGRAVEALRRILKDDVPHPVGSPADDVVRERIVDEFMRLGYQPQVQTTFACSQYASCATVKNVVARLEGTGESGAVLLAAHYDSVPAGPGDSDDGTGAATVVEVARALKSLPPRRHPIIFLLDEGEEEGLLGAQGFVDSHPWAKEVRVAVNVDNRGTDGPSMMFETGSANDWAARFYARYVSRPRADSVAYTIYKLLPNDTDFTIFKGAGYQGMNFAYLKGVSQYHTPLDNSANVSAASVEDHGDQVLPLISALANADFSNWPRGDAVYFTIFGRWMVHWPARRALGWALIGTFLLVAQILWLRHDKRLLPRELLWGLLGWLLTMVVTAAVALVVARLVHMAGATPVTWVAYPAPLEVAFALLGMVVVVTNAIFFSGRAHFWGLWSGVWVWWSLLALAVSLKAPGLSYMLLVPLGVAVVAGLAAAIHPSKSAAAASLAVILPLAGAGIVLMGLLLEMYSALGAPALVPMALLAGFLLTPVAPFCADLRGVQGVRGLAVPWILVGFTSLLLFAALVVPAYSAKSPERVNFRYIVDGDSGNAQWVVEPESGRLPEPIRLAANFRRADRGYLPWNRNPAFLADAPNRDLAAPTFTILESSVNEARRSYRALLRSERGAPFASVLFPPGIDIESVTVGGQPQQAPAPRVRTYLHNWLAYSCPTMSASGVEITFSLPTGKAVDVSVLDESYGLPGEGTFLLHARPLTATASQRGDVTMVIRRVQLLP